MNHESLDQINEWRPKSRWARRFFSTYMKWVVRLGYVVVVAGLGALVFAFVYQVDETVQTDAGDPGWLRGVKVDVGAPGPYASYRLLAQPYTDVKKGQPLVEVILEDGRTEIVTASRDGFLEPDLEATGRGGWAGRPLARIMDYSRLEVEANLKGETVTKAAAGLPAKVTSLDVDRDASVLFAGAEAGRAAAEGLSSKRLVPDGIKGELAEALKGQGVKFDRERAFTIDGIERVELEAVFASLPKGDPRFDPSRSLVLPAKVASGRHWAKVQFSSHDPKVKESVQKELDKTLGPGAASAEGIVLQAAAISASVPLDKADLPSGLVVSLVERRFESVIQLNESPPWLISLVKEMAKKGKKVRAKVEVATGRTPAAMKLLKRG